LEVVEFGRLSSTQRAELERDEGDPFDAVGLMLQWRAKDRHVALRDGDGRLMASAGLLVADLQVGEESVVPVVGIGGVIVSAPHRVHGLASRVIVEALRCAEAMGPAIAILFCHRDRAGLYQRHGFVEIAGPVFVQQPSGFVEMPQLAMWRVIRAGAVLPAGRVVLQSAPF
jgi:predicted GNAT family N-acyltransferase